MKFVTTFDLTKISSPVVDTRCSGGVIGDSVIPGYVDAVLSEKASMLNPMLFGVVDEQAEIIKEERFKVVKNIKMFLATSLYAVELGKIDSETMDAVSEKISKKPRS